MLKARGYVCHVPGEEGSHNSPDQKGKGSLLVLRPRHVGRQRRAGVFLPDSNNPKGTLWEGHAGALGIFPGPGLHLSRGFDPSSVHTGCVTLGMLSSLGLRLRSVTRGDEANRSPRTLPALTFSDSRDGNSFSPILHPILSGVL